MDYHIHTKASPDAKGNIKEFAQKAAGRNINDIGFSEHVSLSPVSGYPWASPDFMPTYVKNFLAFKENSKISIKLGVEVDFVASDFEKIEDFVQRHPFDYVIGAVHFIGGWGFDYRSQMHEYLKRDIFQVYEEYFSLIRELCKCQLFDILAHPDIIKIFGFRPSCDFSSILIETVETMAKSNICAEINTAGLRRPCSEIYPSEAFLKIMYDYDVPIVFGSDAHEPDDVGRNFEEATNLAKRVGYTQACVFNDRKGKFVTV